MKKLMILSFALLTIVSCKKKDEAVEDPDWASSTDQAIANALWQDIYKQVDEEAQSEGTTGARTCGTVSFSSTTFPTTLTIDFGTGCLGNDGRVRKGKIEALFTGPWRDSATVVTVNPINYFVDLYSVSGTKRIENIGKVNGNTTYNVAVTNGQIVDPNGATFTWNSNIKYKWIAGEATTFLTDGINGILDDVYLIEGAYNGVNRNGISFTANTTTDIRKELNCKWPVSGGLSLTPQGLPTRTIDFGNGACDNDATVSVSGFTFTVQMR